MLKILEANVRVVIARETKSLEAASVMSDAQEKQHQGEDQTLFLEAD